MREVDAAVAALRARAHGKEAEVPAVHMRVIGQEAVQPWARGIIWDCEDPERCVPVTRSTRETRFPGARQLDREALWAVAELSWHNEDIVRTASGRGWSGSAGRRRANSTDCPGLPSPRLAGAGRSGEVKLKRIKPSARHCTQGSGARYRNIPSECGKEHRLKVLAGA
eukprot:5272756-Pleurochrysis_carterae.AAC.1